MRKKSVNIYLTTDGWVSVKRKRKRYDITMANVARTNKEITPRPLMDRLTHAVIKETSKSL